MENFRRDSSTALIPPPNHNRNLPSHADPHILEGVAAEVKLLLKLIHEDNASARETDGRRPQRLAAMLAIVDDIRSRVQKSQTYVPNRRAALRRCTTELHRNNNSNAVDTSPRHEDREKKPPLGPTGTADDHHISLRRQLSANMTARKGLEKMFYSLGKEKELIASELSRKVREISSLEELVADLHVQNERLSEKVKSRHGSGGGGAAAAGDGLLQEKNGELSEQLMKALEGYRNVKRRLKEAVEERERMNGRMAEAAAEAEAGIERVRRLKERVGGGGGGDAYEQIVLELCMLERVFLGFYRKMLMAVRESTRRVE